MIDEINKQIRMYSGNVEKVFVRFLLKQPKEEEQVGRNLKKIKEVQKRDSLWL